MRSAIFPVLNLMVVLSLSMVFLGCSLFGPREEEFSFQSETTGQKQTVIVYHPRDYSTDTPVIYLLNGWGADVSAWGSGIDLVEEATKRDIFFVSLTAGENQYVNSYIDSTKRWADFVTEVAEEVEQEFDLDVDWDQRALCGISNGGGGAVYVLSHFPDWFAAAGCLSGSFYTGIDYEGLAERAIRIDVGYGDSNVLTGLRSLRDRLVANEIEHEYHENPGTHNWEFWEKYAPQQFDYLQEFISE